MDEIEGVIYLSPEADLTEDEETACTALLQERASIAWNDSIEVPKTHVFPHLEIADILGSFSLTHERVSAIRNILSEVIDKNDKAVDMLCYTVELAKAMESIGRQLNSVYYSCCQLALDINEDAKLTEVMTEAALDMAARVEKDTAATEN